MFNATFLGRIVDVALPKVPFFNVDIESFNDDKSLSIIHNCWTIGELSRIDSNNKFNSLISSLGINLKDLMISYSYDYNFSELSDSGGSHEISIIYNFNFLGKKIPPKNARFLQCPIPNF